MVADPLVKLQVQAAQGRAILKLGLVVNVTGTKSVDLYPTYGTMSDEELWDQQER